VLLLIALSTGDMSGAKFWIAVAVAVMLGTQLAIRVGMCVLVLWSQRRLTLILDG
jgi:hypothetical protein